jgi:hypothetical protein
MMSRDRTETATKMTGSQSRILSVGTRVCWRDDKNDLGTVTESNWSGVTLKWDNRSQQSILHNDMDSVSVISAPKILKSMTVSTEVNCPACSGTGFPTVPQPDNPSRKIFPPACKQCLGKGRIKPAK